MKKLSIDSKIFIGIMVLAVFGLLLTFFQVQKVGATPAMIGRSQLAAATTSVNYMAVTATTTVYMDAGLALPAFDSAVVAVQFVASSTTSVLGYRFEFANDTSDINCTVSPTQCDWYSDAMVLPTNASTTVNALPLAYTWTFSSSTDACNSSVVFATNNRGCRMIRVPTPSRYTRVLFYKNPGSTTNGAVWAEFITQKER